MQFFEKLTQSWNAFFDKTKPARASAAAWCKTAWHAICNVWVYIVKLRRIILAVPVAWAAIMLAFRNLGKLPELVGLMLQADGTFAVQMGRLPAVLAPLMVTAICLLLMFCSKRVLTPWLASVFSLVIPVVIWIINVYPM